MNAIPLILGDAGSMWLVYVLHSYTCDPDQVWICKYISVELAKARKSEFMPREQAVPH